MVIDGRSEIRRVLFLRRKRQSQYIGVVLDLLVEIGGLVGGVSDLADADHANFSLSHVFPSPARGSEPTTSIIAVPSQSPNPIAIKRSNSSAVRSSSGVATPTLSANSPIIS